MTGITTLRNYFPGVISWRYIIFEHNYDQVVKANKLAIELGFNQFKPMVGDMRTPEHMRLKSKTWEEILNDLSKV